MTGILYKGQYTFMIVSLSFLLGMKNVSVESCRETRNIFYAQ